MATRYKDYKTEILREERKIRKAEKKEMAKKRKEVKERLEKHRKDYKEEIVEFEKKHFSHKPRRPALEECLHGAGIVQRCGAMTLRGTACRQDSRLCRYH